MTKCTIPYSDAHRSGAPLGYFDFASGGIARDVGSWANTPVKDLRALYVKRRGHARASRAGINGCALCTPRTYVRSRYRLALETK